MNLVVLMGRLVKDPETRYSQGDKATAVSKYTLAVNRSFKRDGEQDADFINCIAFGKSGEFAQKYFKKGQLVAVEGELRVSNYTDKEGNKRWSTDVVVSKQHFAESKKEQTQPAQQSSGRGFPPTPKQQEIQNAFEEYQAEEDLPF